jgi:predicted transposase YbfD/YdcC
LDRRRITRVAVSPEEIGLCGCWQVIAVERSSQDQNKPKESASLEIGCYATSLASDERNDAEIMAAIRGHWSAIENGTHYRRDVTLGEDACRTASRTGAAALASLRNLANGIYELQKEQKRTKVDSFKSWCQQQTFTTLWPVLNR